MKPFLLVALALLLLPGPAHAQACTPLSPTACIIEPTAAEGDDVAPYCFLPTLNRGGHDTLYAVTSVVGSECHSFIGYLRFTLPPTLLDPGETVTQARLILPYSFGFEYGQGPNTDPHAPVTMRVHRVTGDWTEGGVTWLDKPAFAELPAAQISGIAQPQTLEFDVTTVVRGWAHGTLPNRGFAVTSPDAHTLGFYSWEAPVGSALKSALLIVTGPDSAPEVPIMPAWIAALLVLGVATVLAIKLPRSGSR
jgi:hypothetical protein